MVDTNIEAGLYDIDDTVYLIVGDVPVKDTVLKVHGNVDGSGDQATRYTLTNYGRKNEADLYVSGAALIAAFTGLAEALDE